MTISGSEIIDQAFGCMSYTEIQEVFDFEEKMGFAFVVLSLLKRIDEKMKPSTIIEKNQFYFLGATDDQTRSLRVLAVLVIIAVNQLEDVNQFNLLLERGMIEFKIGDEVEVILVEKNKSIGKGFVTDWNQTIGTNGTEKLEIELMQPTALKDVKMIEFKLKDKVRVLAKQRFLSPKTGEEGVIEAINSQGYYFKYSYGAYYFQADELELISNYKALGQLWADHMHPPFKAIHKNGTVVEVLAIDYKSETFGHAAIIKASSNIYPGFNANDPVWQLYQEPEEKPEFDVDRAVEELSDIVPKASDWVNDGLPEEKPANDPIMGLIGAYKAGEKNGIENFICMLVDNKEGCTITEEWLVATYAEFLRSDYNK